VHDSNRKGRHMEHLRNESLRNEYISRINKVQDYIETHLDETFTLEKLAHIANFSSYHFHKIFSSITHETLFQYIQRVRLEKAAMLLKTNPKEPIIQIAIRCGFANQASFAKAFKNYFNMTASEFKAKIMKEKFEFNQNIKSNFGKVFKEGLCYNDIKIGEQSCIRALQEDIPFSVEVKNMSEMEVAYIRHTGPFEQDARLFDELFTRLEAWARARVSYDSFYPKKLVITHDDPSLTSKMKLRVSVCMTVPKEIKAEGEVGRLTLLGGRYAVGHFELEPHQYGQAWSLMYAKWLPQSGYEPDDRPSFELYPECHQGGADGKEVVLICIPI
jgi:AraC family transcriptional regulator